MKRAAAAFAVASLMAIASASAVQPDEILPDRAMEQRARGISSELRCLVCQNQSIDDSDAPLARDLRILVRDRLRAGDSDRAVRDFVVARYGEFVLLRPSFNAGTLVLWLGPAAILLAGAWFLWAGRRRAAGPAATALTGPEQARLQALLEDEGSR